MAGLLGGACFVDGCEELPDGADNAFCPTHWRRLPRASRADIVRIRNESERSEGTAKRYVKRLLEATVELKKTPAPV